MPMRKKRPSLRVGQVYEKKYKGKLYRMTIMSLGDELGFKIGSEIYSSSTAAAKAVIGRDQDINGPRFWKMD